MKYHDIAQCTMNDPKIITAQYQCVRISVVIEGNNPPEDLKSELLTRRNRAGRGHLLHSSKHH